MDVVARAWCRVDFAGGTLDIWPLGLLHSGAVTVNAAVDLPAEVTLRPRRTGYRLVQGEETVDARHPRDWLAEPGTALVGHLALATDLPPVEIELRSGSPRGGGLGASSALAVAMIAAAERFQDRPASDVETKSRLARDLEARLMGLPTGKQDHLPALLGGVLAISHQPGGERFERLDVDLDALGESLVVAYTGETHFSAGNNWRIVRRRLDGDASTVALFDRISAAAEAVVAAFTDGDFEAVGRLMSEEWSSRRKLAEGISTPKIEALLETALAAGAWGGKACGAGGGGCIAVMAPRSRRRVVVSELSKQAEILPARPVGGPLLVQSR